MKTASLPVLPEPAARPAPQLQVNPFLHVGDDRVYNPLTDLVPIVQIADVPNVLVVHPSLGAKNFEQFVAYA